MSETLPRHISSAVVTVHPREIDAVLRALGELDNVEVHGTGKGKIVIVMEGHSSVELGNTLVMISAMDGVISANMVFEHFDSDEGGSDGQRTDAA